MRHTTATQDGGTAAWKRTIKTGGDSPAGTYHKTIHLPCRQMAYMPKTSIRLPKRRSAYFAYQY